MDRVLLHREGLVGRCGTLWGWESGRWSDRCRELSFVRGDYRGPSGDYDPIWFIRLSFNMQAI